MRHPSLLYSFSAVVVLGLILSAPSHAKDGDLDPSFGTGGLVLTSLTGSADGLNSLAIQPDGKIVVAGWTGDGTIVLARYNHDGTLDPSFGARGIARTGLPGTAYDLALQPDGRIIVVGRVVYSTSIQGFGVLRLNSDGSTDSSFGKDGLVVERSFGAAARALAVAIQADGNIVVSGEGQSQAFVVVRYDKSGRLDPTFGSGGEVVIAGPEPEAFYRPRALAIQQNGKIVAASAHGIYGSPKMSIRVIRLEPDGSLDPSFGAGGIVDTSEPDGYYDVRGIAIQDDGRILIAAEHTLARYDSDGVLDASFGSGGQVRSNRTIQGVALQSDRKIVVTGTSAGQGGNSMVFFVARYDPDGSLDDSFGTNGVVETSFYLPGANDQASSLAIQSDGKIVVGGSAQVTPSGTIKTDLALARYLSGHVCIPDSDTLCIDDQPGDKRYRVTVTYHTSQGGNDGLDHPGHAISLSPLGVSHGGLFWFFNQKNPEMLIKVLDGSTANSHRWVFYSAGTNVGLTTVVQDTQTGTTVRYTNPDRHSAPPVLDTEAFTADGGPGSPYAQKDQTFNYGDNFRQTTGTRSACVTTDTSLCIGGRFLINVDYHTTQGGGDGLDHPGHAIPLSSIGVDRGGLFWFFSQSNPEMLIKVLNDCPSSGYYWVFYSAGTSVGLTTTVEDTKSGTVNTYTNPDKSQAPPLLDAQAFPCP